MEKSFKSQVKIEDFETLRLIGKGEYGKVLLVRKLSSGELLAMKIIKKKLIEAKNQVEHTKAERSILEKATHPYIVRLRYAFHTNLKLYMAMEYCPGGELYFHLSKYKRFSEDRAKFYASCIVLALNYLHESNVVYRE
jgi:protein-serine/threonine kinase